MEVDGLFILWRRWSNHRALSYFFSEAPRTKAFLPLSPALLLLIHIIYLWLILSLHMFDLQNGIRVTVVGLHPCFKWQNRAHLFVSVTLCVWLFYELDRVDEDLMIPEGKLGLRHGCR